MLNILFNKKGVDFSMSYKLKQMDCLLLPWKRGNILIGWLVGWLVGDVIAPLMLSSTVTPSGEKQTQRPLKTSNTVPPPPSRWICENSSKKRALFSSYRVSEPAIVIFSILNSNTMTPCGTAQTKVLSGLCEPTKTLHSISHDVKKTPDWWPFIFTSKWKYANTLLNSS